MASFGTEKITLSAKIRQASDNPAVLRKNGELPAVLYGHGIDPLPITLPMDQFSKAFRKAGETTIIDIKIEGDDKTHPVLIKDSQIEPQTGQVLHVDLYQINLHEKLHATVPLRFVNDAPAVADFGGVLITNKDEIEVECLPQDLPHDIEVDLSVLKEIDNSILVKDLVVSDKVKILAEPEESIAVITHAAKEEVEVAPESEADALAKIEASKEKSAEEESSENQEK